MSGNWKIETNTTANESAPEKVARKPLTMAQVAELFQVTNRTVMDWARKGILPRWKVGKRVYFDWEDIRRHLGRTARYRGETLEPIEN